MARQAGSARVRLLLGGFIGLAVGYASTALYAFQLRAVDDSPEILAAKAEILEARKARSEQ